RRIGGKSGKDNRSLLDFRERGLFFEIYFLQRPAETLSRKAKKPKVFAELENSLSVVGGDLQNRRSGKNILFQFNSLHIRAILGGRLNAEFAQFRADVGCGNPFITGAASAPFKSIAGEEFFVRAHPLLTHSPILCGRARLSALSMQGSDQAEREDKQTQTSAKRRHNVHHNEEQAV